MGSWEDHLGRAAESRSGGDITRAQASGCKVLISKK
jgi:hypothetical protein